MQTHQILGESGRAAVIQTVAQFQHRHLRQLLTLQRRHRHSLTLRVIRLAQPCQQPHQPLALHQPHHLHSLIQPNSRLGVRALAARRLVPAIQRPHPAVSTPTVVARHSSLLARQVRQQMTAITILALLEAGFTLMDQQAAFTFLKREEHIRFASLLMHHKQRDDEKKRKENSCLSNLYMKCKTG